MSTWQERWGEWVAYGALTAVVVMAIAFGIAMWQAPSREEQAREAVGFFKCVKEPGLPGAAAGKQYWIVGTEEAPPFIDGRAHEGGDQIFVGYCDVNGDSIP